MIPKKYDCAIRRGGRKEKRKRKETLSSFFAVGGRGKRDST